MKKTYTKQYITNNSGCYAPGREDKLKNCSFMNQPGEEVTVNDILDSEIPAVDKIWFVVEFSEFTDNQRRDIAIFELEELRLYREEKYGKNDEVDIFIQASKDFVNKKITYLKLREIERKCGVVGVGGGVGGVGVGVGVVVGVVGVVGGVVGGVGGVGGVGVVGERMLTKLREFIEAA